MKPFSTTTPIDFKLGKRIHNTTRSRGRKYGYYISIRNKHPSSSSNLERYYHYLYGSSYWFYPSCRRIMLKGSTSKRAGHETWQLFNDTLLVWQLHGWNVDSSFLSSIDPSCLGSGSTNSCQVILLHCNCMQLSTFIMNDRILITTDYNVSV